MKKLSLCLVVVALMIAITSCESKSKKLAKELVKQEQLKAEKVEQQKEFNSVFDFLLLNKVDVKDVAFWAKSSGVAFVVTIPKGETVTFVSGNKKSKGELLIDIKGILVNNEVHIINGLIEDAGSLKFSKKTKATWQEFPSVWNFQNLEPYAKVYELSLWYKELPDQNLPDQELETLESFLFWCEKGDSIVVNPKPAGILTIGNKVNLIGVDGGVWKTREQSMANRGEFYLPVE